MAQPLCRSRYLRATGEKGREQRGTVCTVGSRKRRGKLGENVRAVTRLTVCKPTGARARQSALGLLRIGDSMNRGERGGSRPARKRPKPVAQENGRQRKSWLADSARARLCFERICGQPIGCPPRGFPLSEWKLQRRRCGPRFDWGFPFRFLASAVCSHGRTLRLQDPASRSK